MKILAIDTSCRASQTAFKDGDKISSVSVIDSRTHSVKLLPAIETTLAQMNTQPEEIGLVAVTKGPGSFTGLRIGVTTAKMLAYASGIPAVGINTLDYIAYRYRDFNGIVCSLIDARNLRVYGCVYKSGVRSAEYFVGNLSEFLENVTVSFPGEEILFCGDGILNEKIVQYISGNARQPVSFAGSEGAYGSIGELADMAEEIYASAEDKSVFDPNALNIEYMKEWY